jgi:pyridoxal/pyridoxine/pyridoxamine kinase
LGERGSKIIEHIKTARSILDQMEAAYKQALIVNPNALEGHYLHEGKLMQSITDIAQAKERLRSAGFSEADIDSCATFWPSRLREKFTILTKQHQAQFFLLMDGLIEGKLGEPYICKLSKKERQKRLLAK